MIKKLFLLFAIVFIASFAFAQNVVTDSTITITLPRNFDLSNLESLKGTVGLIVSALLTLISGFWSKGNEFLQKFLPTTEKRVAAVGLIIAIVAGLVFGFSKDLLNNIWIAIWGVFGSMGIFGVLKKNPTPELPTPNSQS